MDIDRLPTYFISHGGGPWPWLDGEHRRMHDTLDASLKDMPRQLGVEPKAVLAVSGHWEESEFTVMSTPHPSMLYDYRGFPEHTFHVQYPAPGAPALAGRIQELLVAAGFPVRLEAERGFDHGTFVPLYAMYPDARIPVLQLSLKKGYDPEEHFEIGRALAPLRREGVLILGSGLSYHNLKELGIGGKVPSREFDTWLGETMSAAPSVRKNRLMAWATAPSARLAHPREDHLIPLMVAAGAAESEAAEIVYHDDFMGGNVTVSSFRFGTASAGPRSDYLK